MGATLASLLRLKGGRREASALSLLYHYKQESAGGISAVV